MGNRSGLRVLVCGGRKYRGYMRIFDMLDAYNPEVVIHGDAPGADTGADVWAVVHFYEPGETLLRFPADWRPGGVYNPRAGHERNQRMLDQAKPDVVLAFPGGTGTADMVRRARAAGVHVEEVSD